jgi:hypothetical protein
MRHLQERIPSWETWGLCPNVSYSNQLNLPVYDTHVGEQPELWLKFAQTQQVRATCGKVEIALSDNRQMV